MRIFSREELRQYDGSKGVSYVAYRKKVYDVSHSYHWRTGTHHFTHRAGGDLTHELDDMAPHDATILEKYPIVGELVD